MIKYTGDLRTRPTRIKLLGDLHLYKAAFEPLANISSYVLVVNQRIFASVLSDLDFNEKRGFLDCRLATDIRASSPIVYSHGRGVSRTNRVMLVLKVSAKSCLRAQVLSLTSW